MSKNVKLLLKALAVVLVMFALGYVMGRLLGKGTKGVDLPALLKKVDNEAAGILLTAAHLLLTVAELAMALGEVAHTFIEIAWTHRLFRKKHE